MSARPREGPGDPETAGSPGGEGACRGHQDRPLLVAGRGGRPAAGSARSHRQGVPGVVGQAGQGEEGDGWRSGGAVPAAEYQRCMCSRPPSVVVSIKASLLLHHLHFFSLTPFTDS